MLYFLWCNFDYDNFGILDLNLIFEHNKSVQDIQSHTLHALLLMFYYSLALNQGMCLCCDGMPDEYLIWGLSFFAMVTVWPAPLIWRTLFLALISIEFKFLVSVKIYHIQRIQQIKRLFSVVSTPVYLLLLSPPVQIILSVFFLICSCPLFLSRSGKDMILLLWLSL